MKRWILIGAWGLLAGGVAMMGFSACAPASHGAAERGDQSDAGRRRLAFDPQDQDVPEAPEPEFRPRDVVPPFPVISEVPIESADAGDKQLNPQELVLGVVVGDHARAYPINMLCGPRREIINDTVGGADIAATW